MFHSAEVAVEGHRWAHGVEKVPSSSTPFVFSTFEVHGDCQILREVSILLCHSKERYGQQWEHMTCPHRSLTSSQATDSESDDSTLLTYEVTQQTSYPQWGLSGLTVLLATAG